MKKTSAHTHTPAASTPRRARMTGLYALKPWFTRQLTPILDADAPPVFGAAGRPHRRSLCWRC